MLWLTWAWAASPIQLPPGEAVEDWAPALRLADLAIGAGTPGAEIQVQAGAWLVVVHLADGTTRTVSVPPPTTAREREGVALLAASLLVTGEKPGMPGPGMPGPGIPGAPVAVAGTMPAAGKPVARGDGGGGDEAPPRPGTDDNGASDAEKGRAETGGDARIGEPEAGTGGSAGAASTGAAGTAEAGEAGARTNGAATNGEGEAGAGTAAVDPAAVDPTAVDAGAVDTGAVDTAAVDSGASTASPPDPPPEGPPHPPLLVGLHVGAGLRAEVAGAPLLGADLTLGPLRLAVEVGTAAAVVEDGTLRRGAAHLGAGWAGDRPVAPEVAAGVGGGVWWLYDPDIATQVGTTAFVWGEAGVRWAATSTWGVRGYVRAGVDLRAVTVQPVTGEQVAVGRAWLTPGVAIEARLW